MLSSLKKMRGDKKGWYKVRDLRSGVEIAVPDDRPQAQRQNRHGDGQTSSYVLWDEIVSITPVGREKVYDIEVDGTHNFVGNGIFAHNTYVLKANTMLAVTGEVNAGSFTIPVGSQASASTTLVADIPPEVLTADGTGVDLYKLATYNLMVGKSLDAKVDGQGMRLTSLEARVDALESGAVSSASGSPITLGTTSLASAFESFGALIQNGIAQFNTLVFRQLVASKDADGTSSAGSEIIPTGNAIALVTNSLVKPSTKVFVTFNTQVTGSWWVSDKVAGSFRVVLATPQATDMTFDYFLVQTEGQIDASAPAAGGSSTPSTPPPADTTTPPADTPPPPADPVATTTPAVATDTTAPVVTLNGSAAMQLTVGDTYIEAGATATDDTDGDLTANIIQNGAVDTAIEGTYSLSYDVSDAAGNTGSAGRIVTVSAAAPAAADTATASSTPQQ